MLTNTEKQYGWLTITIHWLVAIAFFALFAVGFWMVDLGYYDDWYRKAPELHKSAGVILLFVMLIRVALKWFQVNPKTLPGITKVQEKAAHIAHFILYLLVFVILISGYLISTADGRGIEVFGLFELPSIGLLFDNQEDIAGTVHKYVAYAGMGLVVLHALAALKHHFIDKDQTLLRMLGKN